MIANYFVLEPECPGSLGNDAQVEDLKKNNPKLLSFQLVLERWPEDDLMESMLGGHAITEKLANALKVSGELIVASINIKNSLQILQNGRQTKIIGEVVKAIIEALSVPRGR